MDSQPSKSILHEDWAVVLVGILIIVAALAGLQLSAPVYSWNNSSELFDNVLALTNLNLVLLQFLYVLIAGAVAILLTGKSIKTFVAGFPVVYVLTIFALILAGS